MYQQSTLARGDRIVMAMQYSHLRVEGTRDALVVYFTGSTILSEESIQAVGRELMTVVETAVRIDMPLVVSFRGIEDVSSALIGKLVLLNKKAKAAGVGLRLSDVSPTVAEVFRRIFPGDGPAGAFAVLKPRPKDDGGHASPPSKDE